LKFFEKSAANLVYTLRKLFHDMINATNIPALELIQVLLYRVPSF